MRLHSRSYTIDEPLIKVIHTPSPSVGYAHPHFSFRGPHTLQGKTIAEACKISGLLSPEEHWSQIAAIDAAHHNGYIPGKSVYRTAHHNELMCDFPTVDDDRVGRIIGYAARPTLLTDDDQVEHIYYHPLLIRWGGIRYKYRQPFAYSINEVTVYDPTQPTAHKAVVGDSTQVS